MFNQKHVFVSKWRKGRVGELYVEVSNIDMTHNSNTFGNYCFVCFTLYSEFR